MELELKGFKPECLSEGEQNPTPADLAVKELNSLLLNDRGKLDTKNGKLWLRDFIVKTLAPELETRIVNVLKAMDVDEEEIKKTQQKLRESLKAREAGKEEIKEPQQKLQESPEGLPKS